MLEHEDLKWIASTSTELNSQLQQIARSCDLVRQTKGARDHVEALEDRVAQAAALAQSLFDRVTTRILASAGRSVAAKKGAPPFSVVPAPADVPAPPAASAAAHPKISVAPKPAPPLPKRGAAAEKPSRQADGIPSEIRVRNPQGPRELVLIVDDEQEILESAATNLTGEGYRVITARDGFEALRIYQQISKQVNLVILDFFLPVMDGDAVFDELRALNPSVNAVLSSGFAEQSKIGMMLAQGLRGFIPKPYTREKLLEQVRSSLDASRVGAS